MTDELSGMCRYPTGTLDSYQECCRCPAGALDSCQEWCRNWPGSIILRLSACTRMPHREDKSMGGIPLFKVGIRN